MHHNAVVRVSLAEVFSRGSVEAFSDERVSILKSILRFAMDYIIPQSGRVGLGHAR